MNWKAGMATGVEIRDQDEDAEDRATHLPLLYGGYLIQVTVHTGPPPGTFREMRKGLFFSSRNLVVLAGEPV